MKRREFIKVASAAVAAPWLPRDGEKPTYRVSMAQLTDPFTEIVLPGDLKSVPVWFGGFDSRRASVAIVRDIEVHKKAGKDWAIVADLEITDLSVARLLRRPDHGGLGLTWMMMTVTSTATGPGLLQQLAIIDRSLIRPPKLYGTGL